MLQNAQGFPATPADVPADYPLRISWPGILVDDPGHPEDIDSPRARSPARHLAGQRRRHRTGSLPNPGRFVPARVLRQPQSLLRRPPQALLQEPPPGADLLAAVHAVGQLHAVALLPPAERPDPLLVRQRFCGAEAGRGRGQRSEVQTAEGRSIQGGEGSGAAEPAWRRSCASSATSCCGWRRFGNPT